MKSPCKLLILTVIVNIFRMEVLRRKMWKLAAEQADERLIALLLAYDKEVTPEKLLGYFGLVKSLFLCLSLGS